MHYRRLTMKKTSFLTLSLLLSMLLAACGTNDELNDTSKLSESEKVEGSNVTNNSTNQQASDENEDAVETEKEDSNTDSNTANNNESSNSNATQGQNQSENNFKISYSLYNQSYDLNYDLVESDNQPFSIPVTEHFELTAEEPGKDMLVFKDNEEIMMRIEQYDLTSISVPDLQQNSIDLINSIASQEQQSEYDLPAEFTSFANVKSYVATINDEKIIIVLFSKDQFMYRLTIFDHASINATNAFLTIASKIQ